MADTLPAGPGLFIPDTVTPPDKPLPFIPAVLGLVRNPLAVWTRAMYRERYHGVRWLGRTTHYVRTPELMKAVLLDQADAFHKSSFQYRLLKPAAGEGLLTSEGEHWRFQRRAAAPAFRIDALRALTPAFVTAADDAVARLAAHGRDTPIDVAAEMQRATLDVIVETILGGSDPGFRHDIVASAITDYVESLGHPDVLDILGVPPWIPRPRDRKGPRAAAALKQAAVDAIARRRASRDDRKDLLGLLLAARDPETGKGLSDDELRDNVVTFIGAGHETTALALSYALYLIANTPDVQDRLLAEVQAVCGDAPIDAAMIDGLVFHDQVIREAMRLYPPVSLIDRVAIRDVVLHDPVVGDVRVKKNEIVLLMVYAMHRHEAQWTRPEAFDPDRFSPERSQARHKFQFMPFGGGPRICIGMKFAYMEATAILAALVRELRFHPNPAHRVQPNIRITLRPEGGMPLFVERR